MENTTYSDFRQNLKKYMDRVNESRAPLCVTRSNKEDIVVLSREDFEGMQETLYLLSSPKNAKRLLDGIEEYKNGKAVDRKLIED